MTTNNDLLTIRQNLEFGRQGLLQLQLVEGVSAQVQTKSARAKLAVDALLKYLDAFSTADDLVGNPDQVTGE